MSWLRCSSSCGLIGWSAGVTVGRAKANDVCLPSDQLVSGSHAELTRADDGHWSVRDFGSSNGTAVRLAAEKAFAACGISNLWEGIGAGGSE